MKIERVEVRVVAPSVQRFTWSHDLQEQYMTNTIVRITTDDGVEGVGGVSNYTSYDYDRYTCETLRHMIPALLGKDPLSHETLWRGLWSRVFPLPPQALAAIDIALWDLMGKVAGLPIYQLLGGATDRIPSYASTPLLADIPSYLRFVEEMIALGFRAVKFHCWCLPENDIALARAVRKEFPAGITFMLDVENNYDLQSALRVGHELADLGFTWFEAPLMDYDLPGYRALTSRVGVPILPSGNWIQDLPAFQHALETRCWSAARTDLTVCGGFTPARKYLSLTEAAGLRCEIMCWGNTLISAANLHLALGTGLCTYYEQPVPWEPYEYGMHDVIRTQPDGHVVAPSGPGLGVQIDWPAMEAATIHRLDTHSRS
ncbi:MAG: mandelate racemase/muconate lactonizing enzyme family protein [Acidobacteria bacterium]|nr:mandelate racemase/muconate lactonizing enzyme family protein [Acidobacteriota bacterium]